MTAIAYKAGFLAADRGISDEDDFWIGSEKKINIMGGKIRNGWFIASAGDSATHLRVQHLLECVENPPLADFADCGDECFGLMISPKLQIYSFEIPCGLYHHDSCPFLAVGVCVPYLYGAMEVTSAGGAVYFASRAHQKVKGPVDVVNCKTGKWEVLQ